MSQLELEVWKAASISDFEIWSGRRTLSKLRNIYECLFKSQAIEFAVKISFIKFGQRQSCCSRHGGKDESKALLESATAAVVVNFCEAVVTFARTCVCVWGGTLSKSARSFHTPVENCWTL